MIVNPKRKRFTLAEAKTIGAKLEIAWDKFDIKQFHLGLNAELADGIYNPLTNFASNDSILVGKVVRAHLTELPSYYTDWAAGEQAAKLQNKHKR